MSSLKTYFKRVRALIGDRKGAALPEFAVAIFPLLWLFFVFVQVATMFTAHLVLHHSAWVAARCGIVQKGGYLPGDYVSNPDGKQATDNGKAEDVCQKAAIDATGIGFWHNMLWNITVKYELKNNAGGKHNEGYGDLVTTVTADYQCHGPVLSNRAVCGNGMKSLKISVTLPHEGAHYTLDSDRNGG